MKKFSKLTFFLFLPVLAFSIFIFNVHAATLGTVPASTACTEGTSCARFIEPDGGGGTQFNSDFGQVNFGCTNCNVLLTSTELTGHAWGDVVGWINFQPSQGGVNNNNGTLSGWAWGENAGWINFNSDVNCDIDNNNFKDVACGGNNTSDPVGLSLVTVSPTNGQFSGQAWAHNYGYLQFDCSVSAPSACVKVAVAAGGGGSGPFTCANGATNYPTCTFPPPPTCTAGVNCPDLCTNVPGDDKGLLPPGYSVVPNTNPVQCTQPITCPPPNTLINNVCTPPVSIPPVVNITYPNSPGNDVFISADISQSDPEFIAAGLPSANFKITATASDPDGTIVQVEFFEGVVSLGKDFTAPYEAQFNKSVTCIVGSKTYAIKAVATDNSGDPAQDVINITVGRKPCVPTPPQCSDQVDNDADGRIDYTGGPNGEPFDADCTSSQDNDESGNFCQLNPNNLAICFCVDPNNIGDPICATITTCNEDPNLPECPKTCANGASDYPACTLACANGAPDYPACTLTATCANGASDYPTCTLVKGEEDDCLTNPNSLACQIKDILPPPGFGLLDPVVAGQVNLGLKIAATTAVIVATAISLAAALFLNPLALPEMVLIPVRLWSLFLTALGLKKRRKPWGVIYDAVTKQPLDPVHVRLVNLEGKEIDSSITDIDGRYGFLAPEGVYKIIPSKTNYIFPSDMLSKRFRDEFYQDLYYGDYLNIKEGEVTFKNIPMDPVNFDWNEFAKNKQQLFKFYSRKELLIARISNWLFNFGFVVAGVALIVSFEQYNMVIFGLYIAMFIMRSMSFKLKAKGRLLERETGLPLAFAFVRVFSAGTNVEIAHGVTDQMGRYYMIVPNGTYNVKIEKKNDDGSYSLIHTSESFPIIHGTLNKVFNV